MSIFQQIHCYFRRYGNGRISTLSFIVLLGLILFFACNKPEPTFPNPSIWLETADGLVSHDSTLLLGAKVKIRIHANTNSDVALTHFNITCTLDSIITAFDTGIYDNEFVYSLNISKGMALNEKLQFYVRDRMGRKSDTISLNLKKDSASIFGDIHYFPSVHLGAQNNSEVGSFYSFNTEQSYFIPEAYLIQNEINLIYLYDLIETDANTIASPGANVDASLFGDEFGLANWTIRNTTRFELKSNLAETDFVNCQNDSLILSNTFVFSSGYRKAKNLVPGMIYAFVTETGQQGLFLLKQVEGQENGTVEFDIKMQD